MDKKKDSFSSSACCDSRILYERSSKQHFSSILSLLQKSNKKKDEGYEIVDKVEVNCQKENKLEAFSFKGSKYET